MPAFNVEMPQVGESVTEAIIGKWLVAPGDVVRKYDPLVEVVTDKVNMEVTATTDGTVTKLIADEGATVAMGSIIAEMEVENGAVQPGANATGEDSTGSTSDTESEDRSGRIGTMIMGANVGPTGGEFQDTSLDVRDDTGDDQPDARSPSRTGNDSGIAGERSAVYSPVVVRLAGRHGIDLDQLSGTGRGGRVTKQDVERYLADRSDQSSASGTDGGAIVAPARTGDELLPPSPVRKMIAEHMARGVREIPHAWAAVEVDMTHVVRLRERHLQHVESATGARLTYLHISAALVSRVIRDHPRLNASWSDDGVVIKGRVNLGIAVAAEHGLVVPVLKDADALDLNGTVRECSRLVDSARRNALSIDDVSDGTFTLNNTGAFGSFLGGAIINHPQAAILNTESITKRPVVIEHPDGSESIGIRPMMNLCLSFDHRVIDGAEAMAFLNDVKSQFESSRVGWTEEAK